MERVTRFPTSRLPLRPLVALLVATTAVVAGCDEPVPGAAAGPAAAASGQPVLTQSRPATPAPPAIATPVTQPPPPVATPVPQVVATVTPTPAPIAPSPGGSTSPSASPSPQASGSPSPSPSPSASAGPFTKTGAPGDLAISGPGYFVLATKPAPLGIEDLLFTRHGKFRLKAETMGAVPVLRLRHADHAFHVVGLVATGEPAAPPAETAGEDQAQLVTTWGGTLAATGLYLDADRNPQAQTALAFDYTGKLLVAGAAPRGLDGQAAAAYVVIAQFDSPDRLVPAVGFPGIFRYETSALEPEEGEEPGGLVRLGVAVSGAGRVVGNANLVVVGSLENP